jgi:NADPH:quinone reductase-like Zn-dependent oxidoreductase
MVTQKAYVFTQYGGPENQEHREIEVPTPGPSEVLVEVHFAGVNPVDWKVREGYLREQMDPPLPVPLGREVSGVVRELGQDVQGLAVGDEVFGAVAPVAGGYAEFALTTGVLTVKKPPRLSFQDAATIPVAGATAYDAVTQLGLREGQTLLINGVGGGVGVVAAQLARDAGVAVLGTAREDKRELVESLGAVHIASGDGVADRVRALLPDGVHAVLDLVGGESLRAVAPLASRPANIVSTGDFTVGELGGAVVERDGTGASFTAVAQLIADGKLSPHVYEVLTLEEAEQALAAVEKGHARGKVVIEVKPG